MATFIKKDCACCPPSVCEGCGCCLYPADSLVNELLTPPDYINTDLPDAVTINGVSKSRSGSSYGDTTDGVIWESADLPVGTRGVWALYEAGVRTTLNCLIGSSNKIQDQFNSTYGLRLTTIGGLDPFPVTRISTCGWFGVYENGLDRTEFYIAYDSNVWVCGGRIFFDGNEEFSEIDTKRRWDEYPPYTASPSNSPEGLYCNGAIVTAV